MSNQENLIKKYSLNINERTSIEWKTSEAQKDSILFYKFNHHSQEEIDHFDKRISKAAFSLCVTNLKKGHDNKEILNLSDTDFNALQMQLLDTVYPLKREKMKLLGVTGTNGKTTCVDLIRQCFLQANQKVLSIGTLGVYLGSKKEKDFSLTTPSLIDLHKTLFEFLPDGGICVMEMSSHALDQERFGNFQFHRIGFTNLSQDHLDYHKNMDDYLKAKMKIFNYVAKSIDVFVPETQAELIKKMDKKISQVSIELSYEEPFFKTRYNRENLALCLALIDDEVSKNKVDISKLSPPPGRFNIFSLKDSFVVIDFAHTPDALLSIGQELKQSFVGYNIITVFGCGGDRDVKKRPLMGKAASEFSEYIILTNDNPRFESGEKIVKDIEVGVTCNYEILLDRRQAVQKGIQLLNKSVLLIAGKGHEAYIDQEGIKTPYNDIDEVRKYLDD